MRRADLAVLFTEMRLRFADLDPRLAATSLYLDDREYSPGSPRTFRDLAWCEPRRLRIVLLERALRLNACRVAGLLAHEFGHLADRRVSHRGREKRADRIAKRALRLAVLYDGDEVQNLCRGQRTRPAHLHQ